MESYSVIVVADETAPVRRFDVRKETVRRAIWGAGIAVALLFGVLADYVRVRIAHVELSSLRALAAEQRELIAAFDTTLDRVQTKLDRIGEFERKVRIIANLPGSVATGGEEIAEVGSDDAPKTQLGADAVASPSNPDEPAPATPAPEATDRGEPRIGELRRDAERLGVVANARELSLAELLDSLEGKRHHLASTPAIWPAKGWMTSRFGTRTSPFTNRRQFHAGIDIAGVRGSDVVAPAEGRVVFSGERGPLGNSLIIDHGYGVRTLYGHTDDLHVKRGEVVKRGQRIASLGNTGRSTGPHLHYVVEVNDKAVNPLDYIFD